MMSKHNAANERIKREYFHYLREAKGRGTASVDAAAKALSRFEESNGHKDFKKFRIEQAVAFKGKLDKKIAVRTGERLSRATVNSTLKALREFFIWLADKPGYKSRIRYSHADYFKLSDKDGGVVEPCDGHFSIFGAPRFLTWLPLSPVTSRGYAIATALYPRLGRRK